jgi:predicted enzyme related to lactoylglutathione lyase
MKSEIQKIDAIWVHIRNIKKARVFYRDVLGLKELQASDEKAFAVYQIPRGPWLGIHRQEKGEAGRPAGTVSGVYFKVKDVKKAAAAIKRRGGKITDRPEKQPWGDWTATVADPDGNEFVITT